MGFKIELKNNEVLLLILENAHEAKASFMQAVENALKRRIIKFEIDLGLESQALDDFYIQVLALQKVLAKRGERIILRSQSSLSNAVEVALHSAGVEMNIENTIQTLPESKLLASALSDSSTSNDMSYSEMYAQAKLKNWPKIDQQLQKVYERLRDLILQERALQKELEFYKKRIVQLRPLVSEKLDLKELHKRAHEQDQPLIQIKIRNQELQDEIARLSSDLQSKQTKYKDLIVKLEPAARKEFEERFH